MKSLNIFPTLLFLILLNVALNAQTVPAKFNYQVSIRNDTGIAISDKLVSFRVSILENPNSITPAYKEEHRDISTKSGICSFVIGEGTNKMNSIETISFQSKSYHIKVEVDVKNGTQYEHLVTSPLVSVPYAMVASQLSQNNATDEQVLKWNENQKKWIPGNEGSGGGSNSLNGDVTGPFMGNKVIKIQGRDVASNAPIDGHVLKWNESLKQWAPGIDNSGSGGSSNDLMGDVTGSPTSNKVIKIQGNLISDQKPKKDQYLKFDGIQWIPVDLLAVPTSKHYIGELFGGGIVFHVFNDNSGVEHGLIVSLNNKRATWSNITNVAIGLSATSTFKGAENTIAIARQMGNNGGAAYLADDSVENGYMDWYLPALDELNLISQARYTLNKILESDSDPNTNGFGVNQFWTSTEAGSSNAWAYNFGEIGASTESKSSMLNYRMIRKF